MSAISIVSPVKAPISFIAFIIAVSVTAVSNRYLQGQPLPYFSGSCGSASGDDWGSASEGTGSASEGTGSADSIDSYGSTKSYRSSRKGFMTIKQKVVGLFSNFT